MTVKELIEVLSQYPEDMEVELNIRFGVWRPITKVGTAMKYRVETYENGQYREAKEIKFCGIQ